MFADDGRTNAASALADLLRRNGRVDEAVDVLLAAVRVEEATHGCTTSALVTMLVDEGRHDDALRCLDELEREFSLADVFRDRVWVLETCGRGDEALDLVRAHPGSGDDHMLVLAAEILERLDRGGDAIALLRPRATSHDVGDALAELLVRRGEVDDAMAVIHAREPMVLWADDPWGGLTVGSADDPSAGPTQERAAAQ
ncbi:hypothetical protein AB0J72_08245 [Dactylosporangium sp. NPDC049742]|uniref:tetratricopeptide repeat protein n=1 Tax=Dactylosporangium sp. NPDC049742 TaxID=3154737 RepID=UPI00343FECBD